MLDSLLNDDILNGNDETLKESETKRQKLIECVLMGNSKTYLGKRYTEEQINDLKQEDIEKLFNAYEGKLSGQMVKSLGKSIIKMYSVSASSLLGIENQCELRDDLENDPFLNSALQRFTCDLYYKYGYFIAPLSVGLITSRHYFSKSFNINYKDGTSPSDDKKSEES